MKFKKIITRTIAVLVVIIALVGVFFYHASAPIRKERKETVQLAEQYANLATDDHFYWYNHGQTYYTVSGKDHEGKEIYVTVPKGSDKITVIPQSDGITSDKAVAIVRDRYGAKSIKKVTFGYFKSKAVWEVVVENHNHTLTYYTLAFHDGKLVNKVEDF